MSVDVETLYRTYGPMVLRRCRSLLREEESAVDAMHDTFVQVLRRQDALEVAAPSSLLYRIATNTCLNKIRTRRRRPEHPDEELLTRIAAADESGTGFARALLGRLFQNEPDSTRTMAVMHLVDGMTLEEVAAEHGLSVSGVRKRLRTLKSRISELEEISP